MKVLFDAEDLNAKLSTLLKLEGLQIHGDIIWNWDDQAGQPTAQMRIEPIPLDEREDEQQRQDTLATLSDAVTDLLQRFDTLTMAVGRMATAKPVTASSTTGHSGKQQKRASEPEPDPEALSPVDRIKAQIKQEENLLMHPMGGAPKKGARRLASNEYEEFPKDE